MTADDDITHDVIVVGSGVAGSRLLAHLLASSWQTRRILVVERDTGRRSDHVLAFWTRRPSALDPLIEHVWSAVRVTAPAGPEQVVALHDHRYAATRRAAITDAIAEAARARPNVEMLRGEVREVVDGPRSAAVRVGDRWYRGAWVFDSRRPAPGAATVRLVQRFTGWIVESSDLRLDAAVATLFDFRTPQLTGACFMYVLPFAAGRALVEHVCIGPEVDHPIAPDTVLRGYLAAQFGLDDEPVVVAREHGCSSLSDAQHPRRTGRRICTIGARGGRLKPSSGYALTRIEADSAAIVRSLTRHGHPFRTPRDRWAYRSLDAIFLWVLAREPAYAPAMFAALMRRPDGTLRFLDERARLIDIVRLLIALPTLVFLRAALRWLAARRVAAPLRR